MLSGNARDSIVAAAPPSCTVYGVSAGSRHVNRKKKGIVDEMYDGDRDNRRPPPGRGTGGRRNPPARGGRQRGAPGNDKPRGGTARRGQSDPPTALCLQITSAVMILFGLALGAVGIKASTNGTGGGIWMIVTFGAVGMMIGAGALGIITTRVRDQKHREKSINTGVLETIENKFFFLMVLLMIVITWLSVYVVFNFDEVKLMAKQGVFIHWQHVWEPLAAETKTDLGKFGCVDEGPPSDSCWDAMQHFLFSSWKLGGFLVMATVVLLPFQIFFVGTRLEWTKTLNSLQTDLCVLMIAMGAALFVLAYTLASAFVVPCVITGLVVIVAGIVQLVPNISCLADVCGVRQALLSGTLVPHSGTLIDVSCASPEFPSRFRAEVGNDFDRRLCCTLGGQSCLLALVYHKS